MRVAIVVFAFVLLACLIFGEPKSDYSNYYDEDSRYETHTLYYDDLDYLDEKYEREMEESYYDSLVDEWEYKHSLNDYDY